MLDPFNLAQKPCGHPTTFVMGAWASWWLDHTFSSAVYSLKYVFRLSGSEKEVLGVYTDGRWTFSVAGSVSSAWTAGHYAYDLLLVRTSDGEKAVLESGFVAVIEPTSDRRSNARIMVDKIDSILMGRADSDVANYAIGSRSITKMTTKELMEWRDYYIAEVARETLRGKLPTLKVRFTG